LIHNIITKNLNEKFDLIITASEDTKINFSLFSKHSKKLEFLNQFSKHTGAIRELLILSHTIKLNFDKKTKQKVFMFEYFIYSVGAKSQSFINKFYVLCDEKGNFISHDSEFVCEMSFNNHLKCAGMDFYTEKFKDLSYFQNIKKEKMENIETRSMGVAKIQIDKGNNNLKKSYFTCAINTLGHCEMALIEIKDCKNLNKNKDRDENNYEKEEEINSNDFEVYRKCRLLKNNQFIGLSIKLLNISVEEKGDLKENKNWKNNFSLKDNYLNESENRNVLSVFEKLHLIMIIGLTNGNLLIVRLDKAESKNPGKNTKLLFYYINFSSIKTLIIY